MALRIVLAHLLIAVIGSVMMADQDITKGPPTYDKPWVPAWGFNKSDHTLWQKHHLSMVKQTEEHKKDIKVVFFGDSKTYGWIGEGKPVWDKYYPKRGAFNYGIRGDSTRQILWRMQHKELDGLSPKLLVFMIGGNNFANNYNRGTDEEIVKAMLIIMDDLRKLLPETKIIFVGQLPRVAATNQRAIDINKLLDVNYAKSNDKMIEWLDFYKSYTNNDGTQNKKLYIEDEIHLNEQGYQLLAQLLEPSIRKTLNESG